MAPPALTIPAEITAEIFGLIPPAVISTASSSPHIPPLLWGQVCGQWRSIVLSTPTLWAALRVEFQSTPLLSKARYRIISELIKVWLQLSDKCPLQLSFKHLYASRQGVPDVVRDTLTAHSSRVAILELDMDVTPSEITVLLDNLSLPFPILRRFSVSVPLSPNRMTCSFTTLAQCSSLRDLTIRGGLFAQVPASIPWAGLTRFCGQGLSLKDAFQILQLATTLEECILECEFGHELSDATLLVHSRLRTLDLLGQAAFPLILLRCLTLPRLTELSLTVWNDERHISAFLSFLSRSSCILTRLDVDITLEATNIATVFSRLPHLVDLRCRTNYIANLTTVLMAQDFHLPRLETLTIKYTYRRPLDSYDALIELLEFRFNATLEGGCVKLKRFELYYRTDVLTGLPQEIYNRLDTLRNAGMRIKVIDAGTERSPSRVLFP